MDYLLRSSWIYTKVSIIINALDNYYNLHIKLDHTSETTADKATRLDTMAGDITPLPTTLVGGGVDFDCARARVMNSVTSERSTTHRRI
jgi:hypothetical protein